MPTARREVRAHASKAAREAAEALFELMLAHRARFEEVSAQIGMSTPLTWTLWLLQPGKPVSMGALAGEMHCDASNITGIVDRLEVRGLVRRQPSPDDRRVKMLALTDEGVRVRAQFLQGIRDPAPWLLALRAEDQEQLRDLLQRMLARTVVTPRTG